MENAKREFYENGNVKEEYQINDSGERHGTTKLYHENGQLQVELNWTNGIQDDGEIISYHDDGSKAKTSNLKNHFLNGPYFEWYKNGKLKTEGSYQDKAPTILKFWNEDGMLIYDRSNEKADNFETLSMLVTFPNTIYSDNPNITNLVKMCHNSSTEFIKYCEDNYCIRGMLDMPKRLLDHLEILNYDFEVTEALTIMDNYLNLDIDFKINLLIKTTKEEAIEAIESYQKDNDDLRYCLSTNWFDSVEKQFYNFDSWDKWFFEDLIYENPCWYEEEED